MLICQSNGIFRAETKNIKYAYGFQINNENLDIFYDEISRAEFDADGKLIKTADLFFLGGGKNVSKVEMVRPFLLRLKEIS